MSQRPQPARVNGTGQPARAATGAPAPTVYRPGIINRAWSGWVWLTGPQPERFGSDITGQERLRRARLMSALVLMVVVVIVLLIPTLFVQPLIWRAVVMLSIGSVLVALLNRWGQVTLSALAYVTLVDLTLAGYILTKPIFTYGNIPNLDLFILALLVSGMVVPRRFIPLIALLHIGLILAIFNIKQHDSLLDEGITSYFAGQRYTAIVNALLLQVCGMVIAWLQAWSVERALVRASRAEELAEARAHINEQARLLAVQKQRLEQGIQMLQEAQARLAEGELNARVSLQDNELFPLAVSFNLMAERLSRVEKSEQDHRRLESTIQQLLGPTTTGQRAAGAVQAPTRAVVDRLAVVLDQRQQFAERLAEGSGMAEDLRSVLQRQQEQFARLETALNTAQAVAKRPAQGEECAELHWLEEMCTASAQARELGARCVKGAQLLSQRLKES